MMSFRWILLAFAVFCSFGAQAWERQYYGGLMLGDVVLEKKPSEIEGSLENQNWPEANVTVGNTGTIVKAYAGAFLTKALGVRLAYIDLGDADIDVTGNIPEGEDAEFAQAALDALPSTGSGFALSLQGRFQLSDQLIFHDWVGLFLWESELSLSLDQSGGNAASKTTASRSGSDFMFGVGLEYLTVGQQLGLRLEAERYNQDGDGVNILGLGAAYYF